MEVIVETKASKYQSQINYQKKRREEDDEYKKKRNEYMRQQNKERYENDPVYKAKVLEKSKLKQTQIREFYNAHKHLIAAN
jgi:hypothetical protein